MHANSHGHGIGAGDVNRDGRTISSLRDGWFDAPMIVRRRVGVSSGLRRRRSFSFMHVTDVNGDGRNDIVTQMRTITGFSGLSRVKASSGPSE